MAGAADTENPSSNPVDPLPDNASVAPVTTEAEGAVLPSTAAPSASAELGTTADASADADSAQEKPAQEFPETLLDKASEKPAADGAEAERPEGDTAKADEEKPDGEAAAEEKAADDGEDKKPDEEKSEDEKAEGEPDTDAEADKVEEPPELEPIDYFAEEAGLKIPENLSLSDEQRGELTSALDAFRADPQRGAQALLDMHANQMAAYAQQVSDKQWETFRETQAEWMKEVLADPVIGGAGHDTAMKRIAAARDHLVSDHKPGTPEYQADLDEFNAAMRITGAGNLKPVLRMMHRAGKLVREADIPPPNPAPPKDAGRDPRRRGKLNYDNTSYQT